MVSTGCASVVLAIQVVAGLPSNADRAWSCGSGCRSTTPGPTPPAAWPIRRRYLLPAQARDQHRGCRAASAWAAAGRGERVVEAVLLLGRAGQRRGAHPPRRGAHARRTATAGPWPAPPPPAAAGGTPGATIDRLAVSPGTVISLMRHLGCRPAARRRGQAGDGELQPAGRARRHPQRLGLAGDLHPVGDLARRGPSPPPGSRPARARAGRRRRPGSTRGSPACVEPQPDPLADRPGQLPDSHMVRRSPSTAAYGSSPLAHWPGMAPMSAADEDAVTSAMPWYRATLRYRAQPGSV